MKKPDYYIDRMRISEIIHDTLKREAEKTGLTMTQVVRSILHRWAVKNSDENLSHLK